MLRCRFFRIAASAGLVLATMMGRCAGQTLRGKVVDPSGAAVARAKVTAKSGTQAESTTTSASGTFQFSTAAVPAKVTASAPGFAATSTTWNGEPKVTLTLEPEPVQDEMVVTATRTATPIAEVAASVSRLSGAEIAASPDLQLDDLLRQVPGFSLFRRSDSRTANPTSQGVSLRGLGASGASRALVMLDGIPLNDPFGGWVYWDRVPETELGSVEVLRGGGSALYGPGALAGVIDLHRKSFRDHAANLDFSGGQQGTANGSASIWQRTGGWNVNVAAQAMRTNGYILVPANLRGGVDTPANVHFGTGYFSLDRLFSTTTVFMGGNLFKESRNNGTVLQVNSTRLGEGFAGADLLAGGGALSLRAYISGQHFHQTFSSIAEDRNSERLVRDQIVPAQQFGTSAVWNRPLGRDNTLAIGADLRRVTGHSAETIWGAQAPIGVSNVGGRQLYFGGFVEDLLRAGSRLNITAAMRFDTWRNFDALSITQSAGKPVVTSPYPARTNGASSPSLGAVFRVNRLVSLTGSAYGALRSPTLNELYRAFRVGNVLTLANNKLDPERLRGVEGGVTVGSGPVYLRATYFWNSIHDVIGNRTLSITPSLITRERQNLGDILSQGVEVELQARLPRNVWTRTAYEYSNSIVSRSLEPALLNLWVPQVPRHAISETIGYDSRRWSGTVVGRYVGGQFEDDLNQFLLPGYFTADTMLRVRVGHGVEPFIACENLLDREYVIGSTPVPTLGSPRLLRVGMRFHWGGEQSAH